MFGVDVEIDVAENVEEEDNVDKELDDVADEVDDGVNVDALIIGSSNLLKLFPSALL